jgi:hypothetical protein
MVEYGRFPHSQKAGTYTMPHPLLNLILWNTVRFIIISTGNKLTAFMTYKALPNTDDALDVDDLRLKGVMVLVNMSNIEYETCVTF